MNNLTPVTTYQTIPIYLNKLKKKKRVWLQWVYEGIQYGVPVTTLNEAMQKAQQMIDATLALTLQGVISSGLGSELLRSHRSTTTLNQRAETNNADTLGFDIRT